MIQQAARDFAQKWNYYQALIERMREQGFQKEEIKKLGELGFMGMMVN